MNPTGRPLRFLGLVVGGWIALRVGAVTIPLLWQTAPAPIGKAAVASTGRPSTPVASPEAATAGSSVSQADPVRPAAPHVKSVWVMPQSVQPSLGQLKPALPASGPAPSPFIALADNRPPPSPAEPALPAPTVVPPSAPGLAGPSHWSLAGWLLWRRDGGASLAQAPLLGGSQGGVRLDYHLWQAGDRSFSLYSRVTRALDRPFAEEGAFGLALRPVKGLPVSVLVERRQRLGAGGRSGFALMAAGGIDPKAILPRVEVEGYAQAGVVGLPGSDGFADGRLSVDYRLAPKPDLALGVAVSGAAQTGVSRLDIGPELRLRLPVAGGHMRLSAEWRQRVAGSARPASGPAVALVADF